MDSFSKGLPFDLRNVWSKSTFELDQNSETLFQPLSADFYQLELSDTDKQYQQDFHLPALEETNGIEYQELERIESEVASPITTSTPPENQTQELGPDVWTLDFDLEELPRLRTWEAFEKKDVPNAERTAYISEAGQNAFDSALIRFEKRAADTGVLSQDVMLRALCNLTLGRSSLFFQWDSGKRSFVRTLADVPISGYSSVSSASFIANVIDLGSAYRVLDDSTSAINIHENPCTAIVAFKGSVASILDSLEEHVTKGISSTRSILPLQKLVTKPHQLLSILRKLTDSVENLNTDEEVISALSDGVHRIVVAEASFSETLKVLLARVSAPWLERLRTDLGLNGNQLDAVLSRSSETAENTVEDVDFSFEGQTRQNDFLPRFVSSDDRALIHETKASLKVLRKHIPDHQVVLPDSTESELPFLAEGSSAVVSNILRGCSEQIEAPPKECISDYLDENEECFGRSELVLSAEPTEDLAWAKHDVQQDYLRACDVRMSQEPKSPWKSPDQLQLAVASAMKRDAFSDVSVIITGSLEFNPVEQLRPLIQSQGKLTKRTLLRNLFWNCRLRHHLDLQRQYHLLGNGDFVGRLETALFSMETQPAERKRGTIPTGETMGLRLGAQDGQRWPPASSELRLSLMGVLNETYHREFGSVSKALDTKDLPGGLSFSIRELPDQDIERVMDSNSIYALDFLRLQYNAPPCIDEVLTPSSMQAYDGIFRFLLRMVRLLHVTTRLRQRLASHLARSRNMTEPKRRFRIKAHHFITILMSHSMDVGIESPWRSFMSSLTEVEEALSSEVDDRNSEKSKLIGLDGLRKLHDECLSCIRSRLFLRRKYDKIRNAIETVFTAILRCATFLENKHDDTFDIEISSFENSMTELLSLLRATIDKPAKADADFDMAQDDTEAMKMLMMSLKWNESRVT